MMYHVQFRMVDEQNWTTVDTMDTLGDALELVQDCMAGDFMDGASGECVYRIVKEG